MITSIKELWSNTNYRIATVIALLMVLWMATGIFASDTPPVKPPEALAAKKEMTAVRARVSDAKLYPLVVSLNGKTEANRAVALRAEVGGQVVNLPVEKGQVVKQGDVICKIAVEDRELRVTEAQSAVAQAQIEYDGSLKLKTGGYQSETAIATAKSRLESAKANLLRRQIDLEKTAIRAPFAGVVDERPVEVGDLMRVGDTCATVLDMDPLLLTAQVAEQDVAHVPQNGSVTARLITGQQFEGKIRYIGRSNDDVTRTYRIEAEIPNPDHDFVSGMTAEIRVLTGEVPAHLVSASLLVLDDNGKLGLRVLDEADVVRLYPVQLVGDASDGVWVTGLPETTRVITVGHQYAAIGERVAVTMESSEELSTKDVSTGSTL